MKKLLLYSLLLFSAAVSAQIVTIPDADFKAALLNAFALNGTEETYIDTNGDNEIQVSEALAVYELEFGGSFEEPLEFTSMQGIEAFTNLEILTISHISVPNLDLTGCHNLKGLTMEYCWDVDALQISGLTQLKHLNCELGPLQGTLDLTSLTALEWIDLSGDIDLILADLPKLTMLNLFGYQGDLLLGSMPLLAWIEASGNYVSVDVSGCPNLDRLILDSDCTYLNLKNGVNDYTIFGIGGGYTPDAPLYVCADEENLEYITELVDSDANYYVVNSYCTFTPSGNYNTITGTLTFDTGSNGCGTGDALNDFMKVTIDDVTHTWATCSNLSGNYNFYTQEGNFTVTPVFENGWFTASPASAVVNFPLAESSVVTENFCITANGFHPDLEAVIVPLEGAQPGFDASYKIVYKNKGNQTLSGAITLTYNDDVLDFITASPVENSSATGVLTWNYSGLAPFEDRQVFIMVNVNGPMETPAVNLDDVLSFTVAAPVAGDETPGDNNFAFNQVVVGSYDPNDIACLEGAAVSPERIGEYLHYNINFENTGTAPATFIVVKNDIDAAQFDVSTLQLLNASHEVQLKVTGNKTEFIFDDINLGAAGKGNVVFKIKTLNTLQVNDDVTQQAEIFFDYNFPIETNEANTVFQVLSSGDFEKDDSVKVYPNPSNGVVNVSADTNVKSIQLYDIQGRLLQTVIVNESAIIIDISSKQAGIYYLKITTDRGAKVAKVIRE